MARPEVDFAQKLRITARVLGCGTRKELCARFRAASPHTEFEPARLAKWMQGTARPRSGQPYEEIAQVLNLGRPGTWVAEIPVAEFEAEACRIHGLAPEGAALAAGARPRAPDNAHLHAAWHCLSPAWSPYFTGQLIRGRLTLEADEVEGLHASYVERIASQTYAFGGPAAVSGRNLHVTLREPAGGLTVLLTTYLPSPPASVICGILAGATMIGPDMAPCSGRFIGLRLPDRPRAEREGYADPRPDIVTADLAAMGGPVSPALGHAVIRFLNGAKPGIVDHVAWAEQAEIAAIADPLYLGGMGARLAAVG